MITLKVSMIQKVKNINMCKKDKLADPIGLIMQFVNTGILDPHIVDVRDISNEKGAVMCICVNGKAYTIDMTDYYFKKGR